FAYLVPAILAATAEQTSDDSSAENDGFPTTAKQNRQAAKDKSADKSRPIRRIVVSTHTIALQEQLIHKDIPLLKAGMPNEFTAVLVKGRHNYVSLRRFRQAQERSISLFNADEEHDQLRKLALWTKETTDGSLADLSYKPMPQVWDEIASDSSNC